MRGALSSSPFPMPDPRSPEALLLEHLGWIDKVAAITCSKHGMWGDDADEFGAWVRMRLVEDDYAAIRKFRGEAALSTFLASVVVRLFYAYDRERRGRWRPSAAAERAGPPATDLEILVRRDGYTVQQAGEKLRTAGRTTLSDVELARILDRLPSRAPLRPVEVAPEAVLHAAPGRGGADERVADAESESERSAVMGALSRAMGELEPEEQMILRMHFADGRTIAEVARALRLDQKPLYRRVERLRARLREILERGGVTGGDVRHLLWEAEAP